MRRNRKLDTLIAIAGVSLSSFATDLFYPIPKVAPSPQRKARILTEEVVNSKAKRADAQWKKEQKFKRR
jgi:hypothetical protein